MQMMATSAFGLEALVAGELRHLGLEVDRVEDARVFFSGGMEELMKANLWLRCADRVFLVVGAFEANTFDELFEGVKALPWEDYIPLGSAFPVKGKSAKSTLFSVSDCQAITKKAIVERLKQKYGKEWLPETGARVTVEVGLLRNRATLCLDASGMGLHRRGYRKLTATAPLRETLAAGLVKLSRWRGDTPFWDPTCGSGTIAVEAAMLARNIAPGLNRSFEAEQWPMMPRQVPKLLREEARAARLEVTPFIMATDIDDRVLSMARYHAAQAGVADCIHFQRMEVSRLQTSRKGGTIVSNPPYGERMLEQKEARQVYKTMGEVFRRLPGWRYDVITSDPGFEQAFGARADKKRKLYNGPMKCTLYQYFKQSE